jgi:hypothetical protein
MITARAALRVVARVRSLRLQRLVRLRRPLEGELPAAEGAEAIKATVAIGDINPGNTHEI